MISILAS